MSASAVILDIDGTLVDSNDAHARAWVDAFADAGVPVPFERIRPAIGMGGDKLLPHVSGLSEDSPAGRRILEQRVEIFRDRYLPTVRAFPRVREMIERFIADGFTPVVATSAKEGEVQALLDRAGVADLIASRSSADDADNSKPDPDIVQAALTQSGAPPDRAIMLGDTPYDVEAALRAGITIVGLESGGWPREDLQGAAQVFATPADLLERYADSLFARMVGRDTRSHAARRPAPSVWWFAAPLIVVGAALLIGELSRQRRRRARMRFAAARRTWRRSGEPGLHSPDEFDELDETRDGTGSHPTLGPRDRERLRRIIARTS
jgi:phosphoglycolate phosphatase-like HAD superfamily hydrolase